MAKKYLEIAVTRAVAEAQKRYFGRSPAVEPGSGRDPLGPDERAFIVARDSFYIATVSEAGWPYIQHRGGRPGFLFVIDPHTLAFADYKGNRQLLTTGNVAANDRVSLFLMDYPRRERLKILGHAHVADASSELVEQLVEPYARPLVERLFFIDVISFDWNCPKYITPRFTAAEVEEAVNPLKKRIAELEAELEALGGRRTSVRGEKMNQAGVRVVCRQ
jgi:predicted pyridoxine 5'-phosphate oxidase superfamily flavin-nucleotide-binding protein